MISDSNFIPGARALKQKELERMFRASARVHGSPSELQANGDGIVLRFATGSREAVEVDELDQELETWRQRHG